MFLEKEVKLEWRDIKSTPYFHSLRGKKEFFIHRVHFEAWGSDNGIDLFNGIKFNTLAEAMKYCEDY